MKIGLSWDFGHKQIFLDASLVMVNELGQIVDCVFYNKIKSDCKSIVHSGYDADRLCPSIYDEIISVNLATIPSHVQYMCLLINSFKG